MNSRVLLQDLKRAVASGSALRRRSLGMAVALAKSGNAANACFRPCLEGPRARSIRELISAF